MKRSILHIILLLWAMLPATTAHSQSYPVQSNVYVVAPYSQTYSDYYADGQQRMFVNILLNDMSQGHLDVVLRFSIKSNNLKLTSKLTGNVQPITIHSGKMYRVEGSELAQYLRVDDMQAEGRLAGEFQKSGKLPEGYYEIKVEVVEYYRRANVSAPSYSTMWIMQPEAPVWTMPQNNAKIDAISPQFMLFGWMMTGNTSMLRNIKYEFSIYEKPASMSADVVVKTSTPIYREELTQQTLVYGPDKPLLELGKVYACRVKVEDGDGLVSFKNDGYSSTLVFKYGEECDPPTQVTITDITKKGATVNWVSDQSHSGYDVEVRELSDGKSSDWFTWKIDKRQYNYEIKQLSSDSRYECRVAAVCGQRTNGIRSAYTDPVEFKTYAAGNKKYNCGDLVEASKPTNQVPYPYLNEGDLITANGHAFVVESISKASGSVFSGQCLWNIEIWNVNILCDFIDIEVNALGELLRGKIVACHDKAQAKAFTRLQSAAYMPAGTQVPSSYKADKIMAMTETVDSVRIVDGETLIYVAGQNPVKVAATDNVFVRSADGNYYAVEDGKVYPKPSNLDKDGNRTLSYDQLITATFGYDDNLGRHAGVDAYSDAKKPFASQYSQYQLHSNDAYATWIAKSQTAIPIARVTVSGGDRAALQFRNGGQTIAATSAADADALYLPLTADGQYDAYYTTQDTHGADLEVMAGQLNVVSYPQQNINVCLVEVNGASYPRTSNELSNYLNDVFGQAVFGVNLTKTSIEVDKFNGTLSAKESGALSAYNSDMKKLIRKVKKLPDYTDDTYYIMLVAKSDNPALGGFMPVNSNFGFVFAQANSGAGQMNRTIAHELAHGAFRLWHTFSSENSYVAQRGSTQNLMDYNGTNAELYKYQWDYIHNPQQGIVRWLVDDEESETIGEERQIVKFEKSALPQQTGEAAFLTLAGLPIPFDDMEKMQEMYFTSKTINESTSIIDGQPLSLITADRGLLVAFRYDGIFYIPEIEQKEDADKHTRIHASDRLFKGYFGKDNYYESTIPNTTKNNNVWWIDNNGKWKEIQFKYEPNKYYCGSKYNDKYRGANYFATFIDRRVGDVRFDGKTYLDELKKLDKTDFFDNAIWARYNPFGEQGLLQKRDVNGEIRLIYSVVGKNGQTEYYEFDYALEDWRRIQVADITDLPFTLELVNKVLKHYGHNMLDAVGLLPFIGEPADLINATWYLCEGEKGDAALCAASMLPIIGDYAAKSVKYTIKAGKAEKLIKTIEGVSWNADNISKLRDAIKANKVEFYADFADATDDVLKKFVDNPDLVDAWNIIKGIHKEDCKNINVLQKVDELRKLPGRENVGFTDDVITDIKGVFYGNNNASTIPYEEVLETCSNFVKSVSKHNIDLGNFSRVIGDLSKGQSYTAGAEWTVRYIGQNGREFAGKKLRFEVNQEVGDKIRRVDMVVEDDILGNIFYEFKSVKDVPPANFLEQFGKDLKNTEVSDLSQIKWIFDGKKVSQQELTETMMKTIKEWKVPEDILRKWGYEGKLQLFKDEKLYPNIDNIFKAE